MRGYSCSRRCNIGTGKRPFILASELPRHLLPPPPPTTLTRPNTQASSNEFRNDEELLHAHHKVQCTILNSESLVESNEENTYGFETPSKPACKHLWKCCVEHHAFFRLVQVSPTTPDIFALGSKFSGRTEKQAQRDAQMRLRTPKIEEKINNENIPPQEIKSVSIPQPAHSAFISVSAAYTGRRAVSPQYSPPTGEQTLRAVPAVPLGPSLTCEGSTLAPVRALCALPVTTANFSTDSPGDPQVSRVRVLTTHALARNITITAAAEVQTMTVSCQNVRVSPMATGDTDIGPTGTRGILGVSRTNITGTVTRVLPGTVQLTEIRTSISPSSAVELNTTSASRPSGSHYELVDSEAQWREVQRKQAEGGTGIHQATVTTVGNRRSGYMNSGMETESEQSYHHKRKHKKHRSRSRSPSETKARLPDELKKHLEFDLIDTEGMSDAQLREIPYKVVETNNKTLRVKLSPNAKRSQRSPRRTKSASTQDERCPPPSNGDSPPPPYSPPQNQNNPTPTNNSETRKSSDNLAGPEDSKRPSESPIIYNGLADIINKHSASSSASQSPAGSLRTRSGHCNDNTNNNIINTASNNNNNHLPRLSSSQYQDYRNISHRTHSSRAFSSALYDNPGTLLGKANGLLAPHINKHQHNNINNTVCHEHSDSGLSAGSQDYSSYVTDRSSEGPKYAQTTKLPTSLSSSLQHSPLPSLVSSTGTTSRGYPFNSMRLPPAGLPHTPVNRHWDMAWGSVYSSPSQPAQGTYRTMPCNANNNWSGGGYGGGGRNSTCNSRGPLYFTHHNTSSSSSTHNVLRDSNKFNTRGRTDATRQGRSGDGDPALQRRSRSASLELILSPIIQSTLQEDDESLEQTGSDTSPYKITNNNNQQHPDHRANGHEVTHEMSTEL
uniref:FERM C-terminal PH-like domain-containing protein n=1 Tax=Timema cristinae TaxID=61476 RepID=A0A7R9CJR2_TIMCR|nr:unnamed protein product [Timema cristinae]